MRALAYLPSPGNGNRRLLARTPITLADHRATTNPNNDKDIDIIISIIIIAAVLAIVITMVVAIATAIVAVILNPIFTMARC